MDRFILILISLIYNANADCGPPGAPSNGSLDEARPRSKEGDEIIYECVNGHRLVHSTLRTCFNGEWTGRVPRCGMYTTL
jgi:hypothetical protein